jgi:hypothetical protein
MRSSLGVEALCGSIVVLWCAGLEPHHEASLNDPSATMNVFGGSWHAIRLFAEEVDSHSCLLKAETH